MHAIYLVLIDKDNAKTSEEAQSEAQSALDINGFAGEGGYFSSCRADWYVIGGRSTGTFTEILNPDTLKDLKAKAQVLIDEDLKEGSLSEHRMDSDMIAINPHIGSKELHATLNALWMEALGVPLMVDTHGGTREDNAVRITPELRKAIKETDWLAKTDTFIPDDFNEIPAQDITEEHDGDWLVIIDYHS